MVVRLALRRWVLQSFTCLLSASAFAGSGNVTSQAASAYNQGVIRYQADQALQAKEAAKKAAQSKAAVEKHMNRDTDTSPYSSTDECSKSVIVSLISQARPLVQEQAKADYEKGLRPTPQIDDRDVLNYVNSEAMANERENLAAHYGCKDTVRKVSNTETMGTLLQTGAQTTATIAAGAAVKNTNEDVAGGENAITSGLKNQGNATITAGGAQGGAGIAQLAYGLRALKIKKDQNAKASELEGANLSGSVDDSESCDTDTVGGGGEEYKCAKKKSLSRVAGAFAGDENKGADLHAEAIAKHREIAARAEEAGTSMLTMGALNVIGGAQRVNEGLAMKQVGETLLTPTNMLVPYAGNPVESGPPPMWVAPGVQYNQGELAQTDGGLLPVPDDGGNYNMQNPDSGSTAPGGLKDEPMYGDHGYASLGSSGGGGVGGGGGGGSGGGSDSGGAAADDEYSAVNQKFDRTGGGGNMAQFGAGGGKARMNDTGEMNINALLEKFLPKKDEKDAEKGAQGLAFSAGDGARAPSSIEDDGSILGPNSNLFARVSSTMALNFKKGNVK